MDDEDLVRELLDKKLGASLPPPPSAEETSEGAVPAAWPQAALDEAEVTEADEAPDDDEDTSFDEEVPVIPPDGDEDLVDATSLSERPTVPKVPQANETAPPRPQTLIERLQYHPPTQFGVLLVVGALVLAVLQLGDRGAPQGPTGFDDVPGGQRFPKIPVDGLEAPLSSDDVRRLLERAGEREARGRPEPPEVVAASSPPQPVRVRARPGELYDDSGRVGVIVGTPEDRARTLRREAEEDRRAAAAAAAAPKVRHGLGPEFFEPGGTLEVKETAPTHNRPSLDLEVGTLFEATLVIGVSSLAPSVVVARVPKAVRVRGRTVVQAGATLRGRARPQQDRLFLTFHTLEQRGETFRFEGYAADKKMPGVPALVRASSFEERGKSGAGRGAVGTAGNVIGELVGQTLPGRIARSVADGVATEAQQDLQPDRTRILELPVGRTFQVVVAGGAS